MKTRLVLLFIIVPFLVVSQAMPDTARVLEEITVRAFAQQNALQDVPAAVAVLQPRDLNRFVNSSLVPAFNLNPGVRLEERSPGSYRVAIRGSSLRSPFGVRNVKVYWNDLPMTDAGGNTYLNQLDPASVSRLEIIKGPGSSLYGAGTGGVLLFYQPPVQDERSLEIGSTIGSYGLQNFQLSFRQGTATTSHVVQYLHQQSEGYRDHTRMARDMINCQSRFTLNDKQALETNVLYSDLFYQTPGGLTQAEFESNPRQARPAAGSLPGAQQQHAHVAQRSFFSGVSHDFQLSRHVHNRTGVYANFVEFGNAAIRNWERRAEQNLGARSITTFNYSRNEFQLKFQSGFEFQRTFSNIGTFANLAGRVGSLQSSDEVISATGLVFAQGTAEWKKWTLTTGVSGNYQSVEFLRLAPAAEYQTRRFPWAWMPRVALLRHLSRNHRVYATISRGFSPPTLAEIRPSTTVFNSTLQAETGQNFETGWRGHTHQGRLSWDLALYHFRLRETIVVRRADDGADFFLNAGSTRQNGAELLLHWQPTLTSRLLQRIRITTGLTWQRYVFQQYAKINADFSGNRLTGVPEEMYSVAVDFTGLSGWYLHAACIYTGSLPLNDANTFRAADYVFTAIKAGWRRAAKKSAWDLFSGIDNATGSTYSLGNDINAAGNRFFNVAPGRQFFVGFRLTIL